MKKIVFVLLLTGCSSEAPKVLNLEDAQRKKSIDSLKVRLDSLTMAGDSLDLVIKKLNP